MSGYVLFQMWAPYRRSLIDRHLFYVEQARKRLLSQFNNMEADADQAADERLEQLDKHFDPDRHEPSDFYEAAHDAGIEFYGMLSDMKDQTYLSVVAGMFHEWDKQLRDWLAREVQHWHRGDNASRKIWSAKFDEIMELLEYFDWEIRSESYYKKLDACRLVVNVYKHGDGPSLDELRSRYPEFLKDPFKGIDVDFSAHLDHTHLKIDDDQIQSFSEAIVAFWRAVPKSVDESHMTEVPNWLGKAIQKDRAEEARAND